MYRISSYSTIFFVLSLLCSTASFSASLQGTVLSATGAPVAEARITLVEEHQETHTDESGHFSFVKLSPGDYLVEVSSALFGSAILRVQLSESARPITIELDQHVHSGSISVTATGRARGLSELAAPVDVLTAEELLLRREATLGDTLAQQAGLAATGYGRGSSRPVIRGLGGDRVRVLENGLDSGDVSSIGPDHATAVETLSTDRIEVVRGPATLLFGGTAVGGVVNLIDQRVPNRVPNQLNGEFLAAGGTNANEYSASVKVDGAAANKLAWHVDAFIRDSDDHESPAPRLESEHDDEHAGDEVPPSGVVPNSFVEANGGNLGLSWVDDRGFIGVAIGGYDSSYGIPGHEQHHGETLYLPHTAPLYAGKQEHLDGVRVELEQRRIDLHGSWKVPATGLESVQIRGGWRDYEHQEIEGDELGTLFENSTTELRAEALLTPLAGFEGVTGLHWSSRDFSASGLEAFVQPTTTDRLAAFLFEELPPAPWGVQLGARIERQNTTSRDPELPDRQFNAASFSGGLTWALATGWLLNLSATHSERAPTAEELYSDGPHAATLTYEIGNPELASEQGNGLDLSLRSSGERVEGAASLFFTRFDDFIYPVDTGEQLDGLDVRRFAQANAEFWGLELHGGVELMHHGAHHLHVEAIFDLVRAELSQSGENLPRIPPQSARLGLLYLGEHLDARLEWRWVDQQDRIAEHEDSTPSFSMLNASASYRLISGSLVHELLLKGSNLLDEEAYNHVSYIKFQAPLPGRNISLSYRLVF